MKLLCSAFGRGLSHFQALSLASEIGLEVLRHSFPPAQTHIVTHPHTVEQTRQNHTQPLPYALILSPICPEVWLKVFYKLCFCLASAAVPEDIQLINVPSQTEAGLKAAHD